MDSNSRRVKVSSTSTGTPSEVVGKGSVIVVVRADDSSIFVISAAA
ncbi:hypothetical protein OHA09_33945 [Streptomyces longwoodensis]|nr:hypothetical protein [Streptomyces longwoodensis]MCX5000346.1 hypothetical protein [Streptomyces longwoodensis]WUC61747.1 hypothetical protein OHA09_33945 [Streptomyces longwoodensis]WUC75315.1 hypothetical protein OG416_33230 [Streptomyces longwoodensis]